MGMSGKIELPPISISWPRHIGKFESHQTFPSWSKMHQNRWRLGLRPDPAGEAYSAPQLLDGLRGEEKERKGRGVEGRGGEREEMGGGNVSPLWNPEYATAHRAPSPNPSAA